MPLSGHRAIRAADSPFDGGWIVEALPIPVVVHNSHGTILSINDAAARLLGQPAAALNEQSLKECLGGSPAFTEAMQRVEKEGTAGWRTESLEVESRLGGPEDERVVVSVLRAAPAPARAAFRRIVECLPQLIWTCRPDGTCDYVSPQWQSYTGVPEAMHLETGWLGVVHPDDSARVVAEWNATSRTGGQFDTEFRIRRHDGAFRWFSTRAVPLRDSAGQIVKWFGTNTDIDDLKQADERLRRYELLSCHTRDIILLVHPESGRIVEANEAAVQEYGYTLAELLAMRIQDLRAPQDTDAVAAQLATATEGQILFETRHRRSDGSVFPVEVSSRGADIEGTRMVVSVVRNIVRRAMAEEALRRSEERFRRAIENIPDLVVIYDRELRVQYANAAACAMTGRTQSDLAGRRDADLWPAEMNAAFLPALEDAVANRTMRTTEAAVPVPGVGPRLLRLTFVPLLDGGGDVCEVLGIGHDFTERKRAEEELRSAALFPAQNPSPVLRVGRAGDLIYSNAAGSPLAVEWGTALGGLVPERIAQAVRDALQQASVNEVEFETAGRLFSFMVAPVHEEHANLYGRDVTESKRTQRALAEAVNRQGLLTDVVGELLASDEPQKIVTRLATDVMRRLDCDMFVNYLVDPAHGLLHLNAYGGIDEEEARAIEWLEYGTAVCGCVAAEGRRIVAENIQRVDDPRTGLVRALGMHAYACFPLVSAGRTIGTLSLGTKNRSTFSPEDLALIEAVAQHMSIALERRHAREELRRSQELYRTIARNIPDGGVWVVDRELRYVLVEGPLAHRYLSGSDVEGRLLSEVLAGPMLDVSTARFQKALAGESNGYEDEFDGRVMWNRFVPLTDEEGHVPFGMALMLDITDRKRMEEQIRQAQKLESVGLLAGGVAHDFNNLLVGILGNASLAQDLIPADHAIRPLLESVARAGEQAANLTRQMLAYSGKGRFVVETLDLSEVVREIVPLARMSLTKRIELRLDTRPGLPPIEADRTQVQQVVTNLVINAGEAIGTEPGHIAIMTGLRRSVDGGADFVFLEVRDTGCGMSEEIRSRVFDPFFSTKFTGRGLGLAAVHGIMRGHGGSISVESTPGAGSTFTALFPASAKVVARTNGRAALPASDAGRGTVLVVDDEPVVRDMAAAALKRFGYEVLLAEDGWQALDVMREHRDGISVVLLDLSMPGLDGEQALPELRKLSPDVAVLVSSGFSETEAMRVFAGQNVAGFVQKPYTVRQLLAKIGAVAGG